MLPELAIRSLECLIAQQQILALKGELHPPRPVSAEPPLQHIQLAQQLACSCHMTVIFPAAEGSKQLTFPFEGLEAVLELNQRVLHRRCLPSVSIRWLRWACGPLHIFSPLRSTAADPRDENRTRSGPIATALFLSYLRRWVKSTARPLLDGIQYRCSDVRGIRSSPHADGKAIAMAGRQSATSGRARRGTAASSGSP